MKIEDIKEGRVVVFTSKADQGHKWEIVGVELLSKGVSLALRRTDSTGLSAYFNVAYWNEVETVD